MYCTALKKGAPHRSSSRPDPCAHSCRSFRFFELPTQADTGNGSAERPCFLSDHIRLLHGGSRQPANGRSSESSPRGSQFPIQEQLLRRNVKRFRGWLVFKAHSLLYRSTLGSRVIQKKQKAHGPHRRPAVIHPTLESSRGQILSQSPTDATSSRWHLNGS